MRQKTFMSKINLQRGKPTVDNRKSREKNGHAQKYRQTVRGSRGVSPGEKMVGHGGKDPQKRKALSLE